MFFSVTVCIQLTVGRTLTAKQKQKGISTELMGIFAFTASHIAVTTFNTFNTVQLQWKMILLTPVALNSQDEESRW